jgi:hypothetical protein
MLFVSFADIMAALTRLSDTAQLLGCRLSFGVSPPPEDLFKSILSLSVFFNIIC